MKRAGPKQVLHVTGHLSQRDANALLLQEGFHGVMRLDEVWRVEMIPLLGTGKTDYKQLRVLILEGTLSAVPAAGAASA